MSRAWWGSGGESWWIIRKMSALLSKIKWQMKLIKVFKLRKILKVSGILGVLITDFNKQTKHPEAK